MWLSRRFPRAASSRPRRADRCPWAAGGALCLPLFLAACAVRPVEPGQATEEPIRFSVELVVDGAAPPAGRPGDDQRFVLEANRNLRTLAGTPSRAQTFPPLIRRLEHHEFTAIYRHVVEHELVAEPTSPMADAPAETPDTAVPPPIFHVTLNVNGKWHQYATTAEESPPTLQLLNQLIAASSAQPRSAWAPEG